MSKFLLSLFFVVVLSIISACSSRIDYHGKLPEEKELAALKIGLHSKEDVMRIAGSPSSVSTFDENVWIYVYRVTRSRSFLDPEILEQKQLIISFDKNGILKSVSIQSDEKDVKASSDKTESSGFKPSFAQQVFGNYGRFAKKGKAD